MRRETPSGTWQTMRVGDAFVKFYFRQPDPSQWNAVAVVRRRVPEATASGCHMIVGVGDSTDAALADLIARVGINARVNGRQAHGAIAPSATATLIHDRHEFEPAGRGESLMHAPVS